MAEDQISPFNNRLGRKDLLGVARALLTLGSLAPPLLTGSLRPTFLVSEPFVRGLRKGRHVRFAVRPSSIVKMVGAKGFEPSTSWSQTRRSTRLSYAPLK